MHADLFSYTPPARYPDAPGAKRTDTSKAAAEAMKPTAAQLQARTLAAIIAAGEYGMTADEAAAALGLSVLSIRPRCSELLNKGQIKDSGIRRANSSGKKAIVWVRA